MESQIASEIRVIIKYATSPDRTSWVPESPKDVYL